MTFTRKDKEAITLRAVMRGAICDQLRSEYQPPKEVPHGLMVLLMQIEDKKHRRKRAH